MSQLSERSRFLLQARRELDEAKPYHEAACDRVAGWLMQLEPELASQCFEDLYEDLSCCETQGRWDDLCRHIGRLDCIGLG